jgi:hypothetical protein
MVLRISALRAIVHNHSNKDTFQMHSKRDAARTQPNDCDGDQALNRVFADIFFCVKKLQYYAFRAVSSSTEVSCQSDLFDPCAAGFRAFKPFSIIIM